MWSSSLVGTLQGIHVFSSGVRGHMKFFSEYPLII
jgi:hypothetical protein